MASLFQKERPSRFDRDEKLIPQSGIGCIPRFLSADEVSEAVKYSKVHIYRLMDRGEFPKRVQIGRNEAQARADGEPEGVDAQVVVPGLLGRGEADLDRLAAVAVRGDFA